ncbi:retron St85 family RNA-directed DNA polymerase [Pseudomonas nunensis]|uniref:retron St85 family RNA-directed DNA polymerase n=1 Tax=Pseudomonas nunensis TaxID=2961896 RepID=UPI0025B09506|nr:retron St85 family RNA-directed DNA polymerase [Pseudomonas nunensis]MDN3221991.1 retron St85 family RNA-directed DNA polymerase [Pseudomonas nunensis]
MSLYDFRKHMAEILSLTEHDVARLIVRAPYAYKRYLIPKKSGGTRPIAQPAKETKVIQGLLIDDWFTQLPIHECAAAYRQGSSIKANAERHKQNSYIAKFDFSNFFGSITESDLVSHFSYVLCGKLSEQSIKDIARMSCVRDKVTARLVLSIGAPSSPILSNSIMYYFDLAMDAWCQERGIIYSRYADDLTFSTNDKGVTSVVEKVIVDTLESIPYPKLRINSEKTVYVSKKRQRRITGLIISNDNNVSLGRDKKRLISAMIHRYAHHELDEKSVLHLQGLIGFAQDVEPLFVAKMRGKYTGKLISELLRQRGAKHK